MGSNFSGNFLYTTTTLRSSNGATGTGFFFSVPLPEIQENAYGYFVATNRHVIEACDDLFIFMNLKDPSTGEPSHSSRATINMPNINGSSHLINHPDPSIDLCLINISQSIQEIEEENGVITSFLTFDLSVIPTKEELNDFHAMEDVVMVGYPSGLWDEVNNLPIMRKGVTATPANFNFNGEEKFLADIATYRGSSGSPLFIHNDGGDIVRNGKKYGESQGVVLLGIAVQIATEVSIGNIEPTDIPSAKDKKPIRSDLNLGYFINSYKLLDFVPIIKDIIKNLENEK